MNPTFVSNAILNKSVGTPSTQPLTLNCCEAVQMKLDGVLSEKLASDIEGVAVCKSDDGVSA